MLLTLLFALTLFAYILTAAAGFRRVADRAAHFIDRTISCLAAAVAIAGVIVLVLLRAGPAH